MTAVPGAHRTCGNRHLAHDHPDLRASGAACAIDPRLRLLCPATSTERAQEVRDGLKRVIGIREVPFRMGRGWMHCAAEIAISHDRDEQMCWLNLDSDDAYT